MALVSAIRSVQHIVIHPPDLTLIDFYLTWSLLFVLYVDSHADCMRVGFCVHCD